MPLSSEIRYARLLRPFPVRRLADGLYQLQAEATAINNAVTDLLIDPPGTPERWRAEVFRLETLVMGLAERCGEARPLLAALYDEADRTFEQSVRAMEAILKGLREQADE